MIWDYLQALTSKYIQNTQKQKKILNKLIQFFSISPENRYLEL